MPQSQTAGDSARDADIADQSQVLELAHGRLADRGIDPAQVIGTGLENQDITVADFYGMLNTIAATEKAGQNPTHGLARLALDAGLPSEVAETLFLAYNQQSAEEAGHGDKVFANAYFAMGGAAPELDASVVGSGSSQFLAPSDDRKANKKRLGGVAGVLGGIETVALSRVFPVVLSMCERWGHPIGRDLAGQIQQTVRPEESRHVLTWRYVFHTLIAPKGPAVIDAYWNATNTGRQNLGAPIFERAELERMVGTAAPTRRQLLGKERIC